MNRIFGSSTKSLDEILSATTAKAAKKSVVIESESDRALAAAFRSWYDKGEEAGQDGEGDGFKRTTAAIGGWAKRCGAQAWIIAAVLYGDPLQSAKHARVAAGQSAIVKKHISDINYWIQTAAAALPGTLADFVQSAHVDAFAAELAEAKKIRAQYAKSLEELRISMKAARKELHEGFRESVVGRGMYGEALWVEMDETSVREDPRTLTLIDAVARGVIKADALEGLFAELHDKMVAESRKRAWDRLADVPPATARVTEGMLMTPRASRPLKSPAAPVAPDDAAVRLLVDDVITRVTSPGGSPDRSASPPPAPAAPAPPGRSGTGTSPRST